MTPIDAAVVFGLAALIVGCYGFAWRCNNHAMTVVAELAEAFNNFRVEWAERLTRLETQIGLEPWKSKKRR